MVPGHPGMVWFGICGLRFVTQCRRVLALFSLADIGGSQPGTGKGGGKSW